MADAMEPRLHNEITGSVFGTSLQAGAIHGDVHLHGQTVDSLTTKFTSAVEHLSSNNAMTRIASVRLLENLGQQQPEFRQLVMDVLCDYLRPAGNHVPDDHERRVLATVQDVVEKHMFMPRRDLRDTSYDVERDVPPAEGTIDKHYWPEVPVDLSGTTLIDFDVSYRCVDDVDFRGARFIGSVAKFSHAFFSASPRFDDAQFATLAEFRHSYFNNGASFDRVYFAAGASFREAYFTGPFKNEDLRHAGVMDTTMMKIF